jgi:hypothetical protein
MADHRAPTKTRWSLRAPWIAAACAVLLLTALPAAAAELDAYGSYWDTDALGDSGGAGVKLSFGSGVLGWEVRAGYFPDLTEDFGTIFDQTLDDELGFEVEAYPLDLGLNAHFARGRQLDLFLSGGVTYFKLDSNLGSLDDEVGYYGGVGLRAGGTFGFYGEVLYRSVEGTLEADPDTIGDLNDVEDNVDVDLSGPTVNAGFSWRF